MELARVALWLALATGASLAAAAEPQPSGDAQTQAPAPASAQADIRSGFESMLANYRSYRVDEPLEDWRAANAEVGRVGGHMGYLKSAPDGGKMQRGAHDR